MIKSLKDLLDKLSRFTNSLVYDGGICKRLKFKDYKKGARPVIYEKTDIAKTFLPPSEHWRIVNFNLESDSSIIDWTHEREWRVKGDFEFELSDVTIIVIKQNQIKKLISKFKEEGIDLMNEINGIVTLEHLLY